MIAMTKVNECSYREVFPTKHFLCLVLVATDRNNEDKDKGFTDVITTSWLHSASRCSYEIRLTFQYNIENEHDQIEIFLIKKNPLEISSVGKWKAITNEKFTEDIESFWQQANITFKADETFRVEQKKNFFAFQNFPLIILFSKIDIEVRHLPDNKFDSTTWFALDDILIENCPNSNFKSFLNLFFVSRYLVPTTTTPQTTSTTTTITTSDTETSLNATISSYSFRLYRRLNQTDENILSSRLSLLSFILYTISTLVGIMLVIILLGLIIFKYRQHCLPKSKSSQPILNHRYHSSRRDKSHHLDPDTRTIITTIR